ncbi:DUF2637 domain-containing protein [Streptomyces katrae]|uniref:DUF2637 domain-containing protein n=1 Tax=Streptomyces katrae TaxID=68223 RepID=A0A0F4J6E0_9ACTN|nr:DUF2637 domain-containing protein [Streptomyces katrae]KJY29409.1 hypothetical protein VR44_23035 [Streptomyces katrae]
MTTTSHRTQAAERYALAVAGCVIIALTAAGFWLSYAHLAEVAGLHGLGTSPARQWAWPATLDAFIVAGEVLMLRASLRRESDGWAIALTAAGSLGSIALNVAGVSRSDGVPASALDYVVAAVPPAAALFAFGVLMRQIHRHVAAEESRHSRRPVGEPSAHPANLDRPRGHSATPQLPDPEWHSGHEGDRPTPAGAIRGASVNVAEETDQVAEACVPPKKRTGRKPAATDDELLDIARTAPLGLKGRASSRHIETAVRARGLPIGRDRRNKITRQVQAELDSGQANAA